MWLFQIYCFSFLGKINEIRRQDVYTIRTAFGKYNIVNERTSMLIKLTSAGFFFLFLFMQGGMCMKQLLHRESSNVFTLQEVQQLLVFFLQIPVACLVQPYTQEEKHKCESHVLQLTKLQLICLLYLKFCQINSTVKMIQGCPPTHAIHHLKPSKSSALPQMSHENLPHSRRQ